MKIAHLMLIPFTGVGIASYRKSEKQHEEWLKERIEIFKSFTLQSLKNQTNKNFLLWLSFREEEKDNLQVRELLNYVKNQGFVYTSTFQGLPYVDDRSSPSLKNKFLNLMRFCKELSKDPSLDFLRSSVKIIRGLLADRNKTLALRFDQIIRQLSVFRRVKCSHWIYLTRLDSDDLLHKEAVERIQSVAPSSKRAITIRNGYVLNLSLKRLSEWNPSTNPPFYTIIFPGKVFLNPQRYLEYYGDFKSHEDIPNVFKCDEIKERLYCVLIHGKNQISTIWDHPFRSKTMEDKSVLKDFGIYE